MLIQHLDKRLRIIDTAVELFTSQGLQQTSMAQLSKESQVAVGTMYHHFKSKDELIEGIFLHINSELGKAIKLTEKESQEDLKTRFSLMSEKTYTFYVKHPFYFFFHDTHNYSPLISQELRDQSRTYYQDWFDLAQEGLETDIFVKQHNILLIRYIYNSLISLVQIKLNHEFNVTSNMLDEMIEMTWKGIT